jgi:4-amino-4-deoxy-L-arabinose transferase-like glycosyltransferase
MDLHASPSSVTPVPRWAPVLEHTLRWALVCWVMVFWRLDYVALIDDGAHYAQLTREMLAGGSWLVPTLDGSPFIDKPVLFHWLQGFAFWMLGESEMAARLPSALGAVALFALTRFLARRLFDEQIAERAWLMLATVPATFVLGRVGYLDMTFTAFTFGALACLFVSAVKEQPRWQYLGYACLVLAVLTKGPVALALVGLCLGLGWLFDAECRAVIRRLQWKTGLLLVVLGAAPWFIWMHGRFGDDFIRGYILDGHAFYLEPRASGSSSRPAFYFEMFVTVFFPWSLVTIGYLVDTIRRRARGLAPPVVEKLLWLWILAVVLLFTAARFRVDRYIFPAAPACCLLAARAWMAARRDSTGHEYGATRLGILFSAVLLAGVGMFVGWRLPNLDLRLPASAYLLPVVLSVGGTAIVVSMMRSRLKPPVLFNAPIGTLVAVYGLVVATGFPVIEDSRPTRRVGQVVRSAVARGERVGLLELDSWQPALRYYGRRQVQRLRSEEEAFGFLAEGRNRLIVTRRDVLERLTRTDPSVEATLAVPAVVGTSGAGVRRQIWSDVVVARRAREPAVQSP